jgi:hypothetical protein
MNIEYKAKMLENKESCNYVDIVLYKRKLSDSVYDIHFTKNECESLLNAISKHDPSLKVFKKHSYKYSNDCIEYTHHFSEDIAIVTANASLGINKDHDKFIIHYMNRQQLPLHTFPSTLVVDSQSDSKRVSVKILNNMYINFDSIDYGNGDVYNHINININLSPSNDLNALNNKLLEYTKLLRMESIC